MKLTCVSLPTNEGWKISKGSGPCKAECPFPELINKGDWENYLSSLKPPAYNKQTEFYWNAKIHEQWCIEFFSEGLPNNPMAQIQAIEPIAEEALNSFMKYSYDQAGQWIKRKEGKIYSFAAWQIENTPWIHIKKCLLENVVTVQPSKAYMPGKGIVGLLPEINIKLPDGQEGRDLATFLTQILNVREELPLPNEVICGYNGLYNL